MSAGAWTLGMAMDRFLAAAETTAAPGTLRVHQEHAKMVRKYFDADRPVTDFSGAPGAELVLTYIKHETGDGDRGLRERFGGSGNLVRALSYSSIRQRVAALKGALRAAINAGQLDAMPAPWPVVLQLAAERSGMPRPEPPAKPRRLPPTVRATGADVAPAVGVLTLGAALDQMKRSRLRRLSAATCQLHGETAALLLRFFGDRPLADFEGSPGYRLLEEYITAEGPDGRGVKYQTLKKRLVTLSLTLKEAQRRGELKEIPPWPDLPADGKPRDRVLSYDEYSRVRAALPTRERLWIDLGAWTGQHSYDISTMTWRLVDLGAGPGFGPGAGPAFWGRRNTKNGLTAPEWLQMPDELRQHLTDAWLSRATPPRPDEAIAGSLDRFNLRKTLARACWKIGIPKFSPIDLRHTCVTWWIEKGGPVDGLKKWLGHATRSEMVHRHYLSVTPTMIGDGVGALNRVSTAAGAGVRYQTLRSLGPVVAGSEVT